MKVIRYAVLAVHKRQFVDIMGMRLPIELSWSNGIVGAIAVFDSRKDAEIYACGKVTIIEVEVESK